MHDVAMKYRLSHFKRWPTLCGRKLCAWKRNKSWEISTMFTVCTVGACPSPVRSEANVDYGHIHIHLILHSHVLSSSELHEIRLATAVLRFRARRFPELVSTRSTGWVTTLRNGTTCDGQSRACSSSTCLACLTYVELCTQ